MKTLVNRTESMQRFNIARICRLAFAPKKLQTLNGECVLNEALNRHRSAISVRRVNF